MAPFGPPVAPPTTRQSIPGLHILRLVAWLLAGLSALATGALWIYTLAETTPDATRWTVLPDPCPTLPASGAQRLSVPAAGRISINLDRGWPRWRTCVWESALNDRGRTVEVRVQVGLFQGRRLGGGSDDKAAEAARSRRHVRDPATDLVDRAAEPDWVCLVPQRGIRLVRVVDNAVLDINWDDIERLRRTGPADAEANFATHREPLKQVADAVIASLR